LLHVIPSIYAVCSYKQQHNKNPCEFHIMPAQPNARYCTSILPSIIIKWRTLEISNLEAYNFSHSLKNAAIEFSSNARYEVITDCWVQKCCTAHSVVFVVLTFLFVVWLVCQMELNLDNGTVIHLFKLWTANKQTNSGYLYRKSKTRIRNKKYRFFFQNITHKFQHY